jgi:hypothetical protein
LLKPESLHEKRKGMTRKTSAYFFILKYSQSISETNLIYLTLNYI